MIAEHRMLRDILDQPQSLRAVLSHQSGEGRSALERAADAIRAARKVIVTGMGASLYAAMPFAFRLQEDGRPAVVIETGELLHFGRELARDAVVVLVSRSGETVEAVQLIPHLRERGALVVCVTNDAASTLALSADVAITVNSRPDEAVAIQSYTGTAMALLLLAAMVAGDDPGKAAGEAVDSLEKSLRDAETQIDSWRSFVSGAPVVYTLGRAASVASAAESSLLFHEAAKLPAVCMTAGGFRHGPVEVVDERFRAVLFACEPRTRGLDCALESALLRMHAQVRTVSVCQGYFSPLLEIVPAQFAAYAAALERGFVPGRFRYVSLVTTSETEFRADGG